jgi:hypothetical protein
MLIGVLGFGSIWSVRPPSGSPHAAYFNTTGVAAAGAYRHRSCVYGYVRIDESTGFRIYSANRAINRIFEAEPLSIWQGKRKLFLRSFVTGESSPDAYLVRLSPGEVGWIDRGSRWICKGGELLSFSEGNGQQEALVILPPYGWIWSGKGTFLLRPDSEGPMRVRLQQTVMR